MARFFGPTKTLGQSGPTGARGLAMNKDGVSPRLESISTADHFIKLTAITPPLKDFYNYFISKLTFRQQRVFEITSVLDPMWIMITTRQEYL